MEKEISFWKVCAIVFAIGLPIILLWPESLSEVSPNREWTVFVRTKTGIFDGGSRKIFLKNNNTGEKYLVEHKSLGSFWDSEHPSKVLWYTNKKFVITSVTTELPHDIDDAYEVRGKPPHIYVVPVDKQLDLPTD